MAVETRERLDAGIELIQGNYSMLYRGTSIRTPYNLIVVDFHRNSDLEVVVHRERVWTDTVIAMQKENALISCIGSFRDPRDIPLGDLVINRVPERTYCPFFRYFLSILKDNRGFRLRKMTQTRTVLRRRGKVAVWAIPEREMQYAKYAMGGLFALVWRGKPLPYSTMNNTMGASRPKYKKSALETPQWRAGYGFSQDSKTFFIVTNNEAPSHWSITTTRDFFVHELPTIDKPAPQVGTFSAYGAFLADFGTGAHLFARRGGKFDKINDKAGSLRGIRSGNVVWIMVK